MTAVALVAVIVDRNPFSLRLLAWSALVVLVLRPESVVGASFQLSFAAVLALMVVYESWIAELADEAAKPGRLTPVWRYLLGVSVTTLVASAATTPLAAFHFQTIPTYGVLANLVAVPLTSFVVMPAGMVGLLLMPLGLDGPAFQMMAWGVEGVLWTARAAAALPGASVLIHQWPGPAWLCSRPAGCGWPSGNGPGAGSGWCPVPRRSWWYSPAVRRICWSTTGWPWPRSATRTAQRR